MGFTVMNKSIERFHKTKLFFPGLLLTCLFILSCALVTGLPVTNEQGTTQFGPDYTPQEHQARTLDAIWNLLEQNYIYYESDTVNWSELQERYDQQVQTGLSTAEFNDLINELESELPAGSLIWQSRADRIEADLATSSTYQGVGAFVAFKAQSVPHVVILSVIKDSPAEQAGLQAHDSIFSIDGEPVRADEGLSVVERIRGPAGSSVILDVKTPGRAKRSVTVTRGELASTAELQTDQIIRNDSNFGYLLFPPIAYDELANDVVGSMQTLTSNRHLDGLILDLRVAGSSRGWPLQEMLTMFNNGVIGEFYNRTGSQIISIDGQDSFGSQSVPLYVLVGQNTIGFPEILAASLQASKRAVVIGAPTTGTIETASTFYLPDGSQAFVQSTSFRLLSGEEPGRNGIKPDLQVGADWDEVTHNADPVLDAALEALGAEQ
jgi:carboxyl-terminal processing protease